MVHSNFVGFTRPQGKGSTERTINRMLSGARQSGGGADQPLIAENMLANPAQETAEPLFPVASPCGRWSPA